MSDPALPSESLASSVRPQTARASEQRRPEIERALLEATEQLLASGTRYAELSVQQLCSEAGIARSTFYVYFRDKSELVIRLADSATATLARAGREWWESNGDRESVTRSTRALIDLYREHAALMLALSEASAFDPTLHSVRLALLDHYAKPLRALIEKGIEAGTVRPIDTATTISTLIWMLEAACNEIVREPSEEMVDRIADSVAAIFWHSLYPDDRPEEVPAE